LNNATIANANIGKDWLPAEAINDLASLDQRIEHVDPSSGRILKQRRCERNAQSETVKSEAIGEGLEAMLEIYEGPKSDGFAGLSLQFRTENLAAFKAGLPPLIECSGPTERPWGSSYLYLTDPNGISVIVFDGGL
jgi:hypothetical protein